MPDRIWVGFHDSLWDDHPDRVNFLKHKRGLTEETIRSAFIGWEQKSGRYTIPIFDLEDRCVNVRRYKPNAKSGEGKMINLKGHGRNRVYVPGDVLDPSRRTLHCAGEWDALLAWQHGWQTSTQTGGEGSRFPAIGLPLMLGQQVVILYDNDEQGRKGAAKTASDLVPHARQVSVADLSTLDLPAKGDVSDVLLRKDLGAGALRQVIADATPWRTEEDVLEAIQRLFLAYDDSARDHLDDVLSDDEVMALPDPEFIVDGWVPRGLYTVIYGEPGVKKTFAMLGISRAVRRGTRWQTHRTRKGAALFYQGEGLAQLKPRIRAWDDRYPLRRDQSMSPGGWFERFVDLTKPEGVAAVVRTIRGYEVRHGCKVELLVIDPLVEFMTGDENGEGMDNATRGLRALAMYLDIGVVVGHHTNAVGGRARGADFHRMRAGAHIRMEELSEGDIGLFQEKQKNSEAVALIVEPVEHKQSLVLEWRDNLPRSAYVMLKESGKRKQSEAKQNDKAQTLEAEVLSALRSATSDKDPAVTKGALFRQVGGNRSKFDAAIGALRGRGVLKVEETGPGKGTWVSFDDAAGGDDGA